MQTQQAGSRRRPWMPLVLLTTSLSACQTAGSCKAIPLVEYDHARSVVIASQIQSSPPELQGFALDAVALRDAVRACRG